VQGQEPGRTAHGSSGHGDEERERNADQGRGCAGGRTAQLPRLRASRVRGRSTTPGRISASREDQRELGEHGKGPRPREDEQGRAGDQHGARP
jgi:hypothetical protein